MNRPEKRNFPTKRWALGSFLAYWLWRRWHGGEDRRPFSESERQKRHAIRSESLERGHEPEEGTTSTTGILVAGAALLLMVLAVLGALVWLFGSWAESKEAAEVSDAPFADYAPVPEGPRLQVDPAVDLQEMHQREDELLHEYAWADRSRGAVRIPIERAMALIAERGLPTRSGASAFADSLLVPTESGFGWARRLPPLPTAPPYLGRSPEPYTPMPELRRILNETRD